MRENGEVSSNVMNEYMEDKRIIHDRLPGSDYAFLEGRGTRVEVCRPRSTSVQSILDFRPPQTVCHAYSRLPAGFSESEVSVCSWAYATCSCLEASHFSTTREVWLERLAWASLSGKYVHISFHAILNSDSKMPASTGQYGSQCGSITMRYSIIHSQCWLSIATYKYLRTRQWHWSHRGGLEPLVFAVSPKGFSQMMMMLMMMMMKKKIVALIFPGV